VTRFWLVLVAWYALVAVAGVWLYRYNTTKGKRAVEEKHGEPHLDAAGWCECWCKKCADYVGSLDEDGSCICPDCAFESDG
jgi:hypothetical protein